MELDVKFTGTHADGPKAGQTFFFQGGVLKLGKDGWTNPAFTQWQQRRQTIMSGD